MHMHEKLLVIIAASGLLLVPAPSLTAQDGSDARSLEGTVRDETVGAPLEDAVVNLQETGTEVRTDSEGRFVLSGLPEGTITLRVSKAGFGSVVEQVESSAAMPGRLEILLPRMDALLQGIQVRANRSESSGSSAWSAQADDERHTTAFDVLASEVPGVTVSQSNGDLGTGSQIRIRGVSTLSGSTSPQIFVDGVRVDHEGPQGAPGTGLAKGVLESIPASQVERIEIVSGPAAAVRYGNGANGVIVVTTKRGVDPDQEEREER